MNINYTFKQKKFFSTEFQEYFLKEQQKYIKLGIPFPTFEKMELRYKIQKGLINKNNIEQENINWDLKNKEESIKCKIDNENEMNVIYQNHFLTSDFYEYENTMYNCFEKFYSNNYKIIVIEDQNGGGYSNLCIPFTQYINPKVSKFHKIASKSSNLFKNHF